MCAENFSTERVALGITEINEHTTWEECIINYTPNGRRQFARPNLRWSVQPCSVGGREGTAGPNFDADNYNVTDNNWNISDYHSHDGKKK
jgi:hypothetical protein